MSKKIIEKNLLLKVVLSLGIFALIMTANFALAETCPSNTMVTGTTVVFVGDLADMGGDSTTYVWFEYGQTTGYGQRTIEKTLTDTEFYCITVSGLIPSTTYHYRAVARNSADTSYGEDKTFTTLSGPSVDLRVNGSNGPISVYYNGSANLTWYSSNVSSCYASNGWSGTKAVSGSESRTNLTSSKTYTITCNGSGGSVSDSVSVNVDNYQNDNPPVANAGSNKTVYDLNYRYTNRPVFNAPSVSYTRNYTCTLTVTDDEGYTDSDSMTVSVKNRYNDDEDVELKVSQVVKNVSDGDTIWYNSLYADPGEDLLFRITVKSTGDTEARNVKVKNVLPSKIVYKGNLRIDGDYSSKNINTDSIDIGDLSPNQTVTITFEAEVKSKSNFDYGTTNLIRKLNLRATLIMELQI